MKEERIYTVYLHTTPSGKYYVGITSTEVDKRWQHGQGYRSQFFYKAIEKYGWDNIDHEIVASNLTKEEAENFEIKLISELHSNEKDFGYNIEKGGNHQGKHSEETKRKISEATKGENNPRYGVVLSEETKYKIGIGNKNKIISEETKRKISEAHKGKKKSPLSEEAKKNISNGRKGKGIGRSVVITEETKQKMSEAKKGKYKGGKHPKAKKIICENIEFDCIKDCADFYGIPKTTMTAWLNGRAKMRQDFVEKGLRYK